MSVKFKFTPFKDKNSHFDDYKKFHENPLPEYKNLPDGEYLIRNSKNNRSFYIKLNGRWVWEYDECNHSQFYRGEYNIFPQLPEKEWEMMGKIYDKLSHKWQMNYHAHKSFMNLRDMKRQTRKFFRK